MKLKLTAIGMAIFAFSATAHAAYTSDTTVTDVTVETGTNFARVALLSSPTSGVRPGCHNATYTKHYSFDVSTSKGKALLSLAMAALLSGRQLAVLGTGTCLNVGPAFVEEVSSLTMK